MKAKVSFRISIIFTALLLGVPALGQESPHRLFARADSARMNYDFPTAAALCSQALESLDTASRARFESRSLYASNGLSMMDFCSTPTVVAKQVMPLEDFFLFYPLPNHSWRETPNQLDTLGGGNLAKATYVPDGAGTIVFSSKDKNGGRNIFITSLLDSVWTAPVPVNAQYTDDADDIYPMLSPDGESVFFASKGLYGMGGYDLYVTRLDKETGSWSTPENMGFPYSSPYDDFLFINTPDGKYSIFASNRECSADSVCIYVLEYDGMPVRKAIGDVAQLRELCRLAPSGDKARFDNGSAVSVAGDGDDQTGEYMAKMKEVRALRDSVSAFNASLDELRERYMSAEESGKERIAGIISEKETRLLALDASLNRAVKELQAIEMDFLSKGIVLDTRKLQAAADKQVVGAATAYTFTKNSFGKPFRLNILKPEPMDLQIPEPGEEGLMVTIRPANGKSLSTGALEAIKDLLEGDIIRSNENGQVTYMAGPIETKEKAAELVEKLREAGETFISFE